jgi:hypothetical protein
MGKIKFISIKSKRSIVSCNECRRRKKRCDEQKPNCGACLKRNVECKYHQDTKESQTKALFDNNKKDNKNGNNSNNIDNIGTIDSIDKIDKTDKLDNIDNIDNIDDKNSSVIINNHGQILKSPDYSNWMKYLSISPESMSAMTMSNFDIYINSPDFQPLDSMSSEFFTINNNYNINNIRFDIDLEIIARTLIDSFKIKIDNNTNIYENFKITNKFVKSFNILYPITFKSDPILITLAAWLLLINNEYSQSEQFFKESIEICNKLEIKIEYSNNWTEDNLIDYIVCLTCQTIISSLNSDTLLWKLSFEKLFTILKKIGLDMFILLIKKPENKMIFIWVINWFFYQDVFKMIKVTSNRLLGPLFSKKEYKKFITNEEFTDIFDKNDLFENSISCCINLHIALGEINALYDQFAIEIQKVIKTYYKNIKPILDSIKDYNEKIKFVNSEIYLNYELVRSNFHDWVKEKTSLLETRILDCRINLDGIQLPINSELLDYFKLIKLSVLLYMKFKIKELSATSYEIKQLVLQIFSKFRIILKTNKFDKQLLFPLLIVGANICEERDRIMVTGFYQQIKNNNLPRKNVEQVWKIILEFWKLNPNGLSFDMWQNIINKYDWNVCII